MQFVVCYLTKVRVVDAELYAIYVLKLAAQVTLVEIYRTATSTATIVRFAKEFPSDLYHLVTSVKTLAHQATDGPEVTNDGKKEE